MKDRVVTARNEIIMRLRGATSSPSETISLFPERENVTRVTSLVTKVTGVSAIRLCGLGPFSFNNLPCHPPLQLPRIEQLLGAGAQGIAEQLGEIAGAVNVERDSGKIGVVEHD